MPSKDKRKLAAIMFADVVGYSRMMASNEERTLELLKDFENICSPIISKHDGEIIKKVGDELFCEFSSAKQAVDSALEIQEAIQPYNDSRPKDFKLQVRIGIHVGDIILRDGDVFGDGVNVASRIQPFATPGGICISNAVKEAIASHPSYNIISEGQQELKNIVEKHTLYRVETGFENNERKNKIYFTSPIKKYLTIIFTMLMLIVGYYGYKNYNLLINLYSLQKNIDVGDKYIFLFDQIFSEEGFFAIQYLKNTTQEYKDLNFKAIPDSTLSNVYNEVLSLLSNKMSPSIDLISRNTLRNDFAIKGELVPVYDLRFERAFVENISKNFVDTAKDNFDNSTNLIMVKSGANIGSFVILSEISNSKDENKYFYIHLSRQVAHNGEMFSNINAGINMGRTSEDRLVDDLSNVIITSIPDLKPSFQGLVTNINSSEILFKFNDSCLDLIDVGYILNVKRKYADADIFGDDLIEYEQKLILDNDTTSKWFIDFYQPEQLGWSKFELDLIKSDNHYILKKDNQHGAAYTMGTSEFPRLKIESLYDSTGIATIYKVSDPYHTLKVGDILVLE